MSRALSPLLSAVVLLAAAPGIRAADDDPKAILTRAIKTHGGEEFLTKHQAARSTNKGKINIPGLGEAEFTQEIQYMLPDKLKDSLELSIAGQKVTVATLMNGDKISIDAAGKPVEITDAIKTAMKDATQMMKVARLVPLVKDKEYELSLFGEAKVEDKPAVGVRVAEKGQKDITLFFDKATGLLVKVERRTVEGATGNEVNEERIVREYAKDKDGIPIPKKLLIKHDGKTFIEAEGEITYLEKIDDSEFRK